eukprot:GHVN01049775.1.p1 GENE.GHVN01049775.1~~GHVN01049775.1.p1  ORF type:complete len:320 (+),score=-0.99 GHVN01049775.1:768-1727(+)
MDNHPTPLRHESNNRCKCLPGNRDIPEQRANRFLPAQLRPTNRRTVVRGARGYSPSFTKKIEDADLLLSPVPWISPVLASTADKNTGSLIYLFRGTSPDITFVVRHLSRHLTKWSTQNHAEPTRLMGYLARTANFSLTFAVPGDCDLLQLRRGLTRSSEETQPLENPPGWVTSHAAAVLSSPLGVQTISLQLLESLFDTAIPSNEALRTNHPTSSQRIRYPSAKYGDCSREIRPRRELFPLPLLRRLPNVKRKTIKDCYPLPRISQLLRAVKSPKYFVALNHKIFFRSQRLTRLRQPPTSNSFILPSSLNVCLNRVILP